MTYGMVTLRRPWVSSNHPFL